MHIIIRVVFVTVFSIIFTVGCARCAKSSSRMSHNSVGNMQFVHSMEDLNKQSQSVQPHTLTTYPTGGQMQPARSMQQLDNQSKSVQPYMITSYPKNANIGSAVFVDLEAEKYKILNYMNSVRARGNECGPSAQPLGWNRQLADAAQSHARDMASKGFLGHMGSGGDTDEAKKAPGRGSNFYERIMYYGYPIKAGELAGEIISYTKFNVVGDQEPYANFVHAINNFLRSPKHCGLLMHHRFHDVGIGAYKDQEKMYWVIEFGEVNY